MTSARSCSPSAELKVFLTASSEERARRRTAQQSENGVEVAEEDVRVAIERRDQADSTREHSPLAVADDAVRIDTTGMSIDQVVERIADLAEEPRLMRPSEVRGKPMFGDGAPKWRFARFIRRVLVPVALRIYRVRFLGTENLPDGPVICAGNHVSYLDPILLWAGSPRQLHFVAKAELWEIGWLGWALDHFWAIPVRRATADREMIAMRL